jgi:pimeloyl-ACP methyl ester carboxylesterase
LTPLSASHFFEQALEVQPPNNNTTFRVYLTPPKLSIPGQHQGGHTGAKGKGKDNGTYLVCHHGAGASGLSFAALGKYAAESSSGELGVLSFDCRGHGRPSQCNECRTDWNDVQERQDPKGESMRIPIYHYPPYFQIYWVSSSTSFRNLPALLLFWSAILQTYHIVAETRI